MQETIVFLTVCVFLIAVFGVSVYAAIKGNETAKYFLWAWSALLLMSLPFAARSSARISSLVAALMLIFFIYVLYLMNKKGVERLEASHEEMRRVLAESNARVDDERRLISSRLHDDVNQTLIIVRNELHRLVPLIKDNVKATEISRNLIEMVGQAYNTARDIIKNTRIEVIDSIGFTAAVESLVAHYTDFFDKPAIHLHHNLPRRPEMAEPVALNAYKIIREAIFNAIKHAGAKQVVVSIVYDGTFYKVDISDDGCGIKAKSQQGGGDIAGIGLIDMRERARVIGATLKVQATSPGDPKRPGTKISFVFSDQGR